MRGRMAGMKPSHQRGWARAGLVAGGAIFVAKGAIGENDVDGLPVRRRKLVPRDRV
jgi:hypothetical protein